MKPINFKILICFLMYGSTILGATNDIDLAGKWDFKLDPENIGIAQKWYTDNFADTISLPGSTDQAGYGKKINTAHLDRLTREYEYVGAAWYQKTVSIPKEWEGKRIELFLERCHWETRVWIDGKDTGMRESLSVPHEYDLSSVLTPGTHKIVIRVDNAPKYQIGLLGHSITEHTQTNWNGIIGRLELRASPPVWVESVQAWPNISKKSVLVKAHIGNITGKDLTATASARVYDSNNIVVGQVSSPKSISSDSESQFELEINMPVDVHLWDEFSPSLYHLEVKFDESTYSQKFGFREVSVKGRRISINDRPVFLRGTLECCIFPLTGYPPTELSAWAGIFKKIQSYGLNHMRFHSWCPPEAAFVAADQLGVYLQVELPNWTAVGVHEPTDQFWREELDRMLDVYGNHPSFTFMGMGNELQGEAKFLSELIKRGKERDSRHLYTGRTAYGTVPEDDFYIAHYFNDHVRGVHAQGTAHDFSNGIATAKTPFISHETGQWCVYPDFDEIKKYTGHLKPRNLEFYRDSLEKNNMSGLNKKFQQASGALALLLYKEEMEAALRTPGFGGFQLLDLHDFPGQGTALVGILDAFWDSKGLVTPDQFRRYCSQTVPLLRMSKRVWSSNETFTAKTQVAHFGAEPIKEAVFSWNATNEQGDILAQGDLPAIDVPVDNNTFPGEISFSLHEISTPTKVVLTVGIKGSQISNSWEAWVYPAVTEKIAAGDVLISNVFNETVQQKLHEGGNVLLLINSATQNTVATDFEPIFWCGAYFKGQPRQLGILCDPNHPGLADFPTDFHTNWQWYHLLKGAKSLNLENLPIELEPIVRIVDDWNTNRPLGLIVEAKAGNGKLITCGLDLQGDALNRPEASQLLKSLLMYMQSSNFKPEQKVSVQTFIDLFEHPYLSIDGLSSEDAGSEGRFAVDGDPATIWHSKWQGTAAPYPHSITLRLKVSAEISGITYLPRQGGSQNGWISDYEVHVSRDGKEWGEAVSKGAFNKGVEKKTVRFNKPQRARYIRFTALKGFGENPWAAVAELDVSFKDGVAIALNQLVGEGNARVDNQANGYEAINAIDGKKETFWHTDWSDTGPGFPHLIQLDTQNQSVITGVRWLPRQDMSRGLIKDYEIYVSKDKTNWGVPVKSGSVKLTQEWTEVRFEKPVEGRFLRLKGLSSHHGEKYVSIAEIEVLTNLEK